MPQLRGRMQPEVLMRPSLHCLSWLAAESSLELKGVIFSWHCLLSAMLIASIKYIQHA